jgi:succinoglycan biosynthesis protein ExoM
MKEPMHKQEHLLKKNVLYSVCVATYRRPQLLKKLLQRLSQQSLPDKVSIEIIVVDNDSKKSANPIVGQFSDSKKVRFSYYSQPIKNISLTRNLAIDKACGKYLLFIDDDESPISDWVMHLVKTLEKYNADGVFGYVEPVFNDKTPNWMRRRDLFFYGNVGKTGTETKATYTNNCIVKASLLKKMEQPFDPSYGTTGGEDIQLFRRLALEGARFINCREAAVTEFLPASRTRVGYFFIRGLSGGNRDTRVCIELSGNRRTFVRAYMLFKSLGYGFISLLFLMLFSPSKILRTKWLIKLASNIGRFMAVFGWHYHQYS